MFKSPQHATLQILNREIEVYQPVVLFGDVGLDVGFILFCIRQLI